MSPACATCAAAGRPGLEIPTRPSLRRPILTALVLSVVILAGPYVVPDSSTRSAGFKGQSSERVVLLDQAHHAIDPNRTVPPSEALLGCIRKYETGHGWDTRGDYTANGRYKGAYQFAQSTWNEAARTSVHTDWIGRNPATAPHEIQDSLAGHLYRQQGLRPWPTPNRKCRG
jgi:hypothetical protein